MIVEKCKRNPFLLVINRERERILCEKHLNKRILMYVCVDKKKIKKKNCMKAMCESFYKHVCVFVSYDGFFIEMEKTR